MNIIGTGLSGLVGSRIVELLSDDTFEDLSLETGVDITDYNIVNSRIGKSPAAWVFHFAAYTDVQGAEKEKSLGKDSLAWKINVLATENIVAACKQTGKKIIYIDTDYAFDGSKKEPYTEEDTPHPLGWYAMTKYEGAKRVLALGDQSVVIRIANPYRANPIGKKDFLHKMLERMQSGQTIAGATDQLFVPTFIDDIAAALKALLKANATGLYHVVGSSSLSPYEAGRTIARVWGIDESLVTETTFAQFFSGRAAIPQYANLSNAKIHTLGIDMRTFEEGLREVKRMEYNK